MSEFLIKQSNDLAQVTAALFSLPELLKQNKKFVVSIKEHKEKRSLNANAYFWQLCSKIAETVSTTKEEVYQRFIKEQHVYKDVEIREDAAGTFMTAWGMHGIGWLSEKIDYSQTKGFVTIRAYYGSSVYNTKQMSRLIDSAVSECKELGIDTKTPDQIAEMMSLWGKEK